MNKDYREVISLTFEAIITIIVLVGGGFLLYSGKGAEVTATAISAITLVLTFWFNRRQNQQQANHVENMVQQNQQSNTGSVPDDSNKSGQ